MSIRADVRSLDAIEAFRGNLAKYLERARATLDEVDAEVVRTRSWLESDQKTYLMNQVRIRSRELEETKQARFNVNLSAFRGEQSSRMAVHRSERLLREAEDKVKVLKRWCGKYDNKVEPLKRQVDRLRNVLDYDLPRAIAHLANIVRTLDEYAATPPPGTSEAINFGNRTESTERTVEEQHGDPS